MQSFELRTRNEINTSMLLGLIILALIAPLSKSIIFGGAILVYLCLLASLLYFDCVKRTGENAVKEPIPEVALTPSNEKKNAFFKGNAIMCLSALPLVSLVFFLLLPRADGFVDNIYTYISSTFGTKTSTPMMMPDALPEKAKRWSPPERKRQKAAKPLLSSEKKKTSEHPGDGKSPEDLEKSDADTKGGADAKAESAKSVAGKTEDRKNAKKLQATKSLLMRKVVARTVKAPEELKIKTRRLKTVPRPESTISLMTTPLTSHNLQIRLTS